MSDKTINNKTNSELSEAYFYETRVIGSIPQPGQGESAQISSTTIEIFAAFNGENAKPVITFTADHNSPDSMMVKVLQPIDPQDFAALCEHYTHGLVTNEGQTMADEYQTEWAQQMGYVCVNANGLKVGAEDLIEVN